MKFDDIKLQKQVTKLITSMGVKFTFTRTESSVVDGSLVTSTKKLGSVMGVMDTQDSRNSADTTSTQYSINDRKIIIAANMKWVPQVDDTVTFESQTWKVKSVNTTAPKVKTNLVHEVTVA